MTAAYPLNATFGLTPDQDDYLTALCELTGSSRANSLRRMFEEYRIAHPVAKRRPKGILEVSAAWRDAHHEL